MSYGICPNCEIEVNVGDNPAVGHEITCKSCLITSVIVWLNPIELVVIDPDEYDDQYDDVEDDEEYIEDFHPEV